MNPEVLEPIRDGAWLYAAGPLLGLAALVLTVRLGLPQIRQLPAATRALRQDPDADGTVTPAIGATLAAVGSFGAAAAVGAATAISLGGAGAIAWLWLFGFALAPMRLAETLLSRTDAPGGGESAEAGTLARRLLRSGDRPSRLTGWAVAALVALSAFAFVGGVHGGALDRALEHALPDSGPWLLGGVAAVAALLAVAGPRRAGAIAGWVGLLGLVLLFGLASWAALSSPGEMVEVIGRTVGEAFGGAPAAEPFTGAFAGEIAFAAILHALPPAGASGAIAGAAHGQARAPSTRGQAAAAVLGPLAFAIVTTAVAVAAVTTGSYYEPVDSTRPLTELRFVHSPAPDTASQRQESNRYYEGYVRIRDGELLGTGVELMTPRGPVENASFTYFGEPADVALRIEQGTPVQMMRPQAPHGALDSVPAEQTRDVRVRGEMLPNGAELINLALGRPTGGTLGARLGLAALLALMAVAAGIWGIAASRSLPRAAHRGAQLAVALLPALGLALQASGWAPWLPPLGGLAGALLASVVALVLLARSGEVATLARPKRSSI